MIGSKKYKHQIIINIQWYKWLAMGYYSECISKISLYRRDYFKNRHDYYGPQSFILEFITKYPITDFSRKLCLLSFQ